MARASELVVGIGIEPVNLKNATAVHGVSGLPRRIGVIIDCLRYSGSIPAGHRPRYVRGSQQGKLFYGKEAQVNRRERSELGMKKYKGLRDQTSIAERTIHAAGGGRRAEAATSDCCELRIATYLGHVTRSSKQQKSC